MASAKLDLILELKNKLMGGFGKARQYVNSELKGLSDRAKSFKTSVVDSFKGMLDGVKNPFTNFSGAASQAFEGIKDEVPGVSRALSLLANPFALITAGAVAFGAFTAQATNMAIKWEKSLAQVNVTAGLTPRKLDELGDKLLMVGAKGSNDLDQVPMAFNRIISAGLDVNQSMAALEPTLKAAKAGFADVSVVAAAGVGVMKSSGEDINKVYDVLFATLNKGNAEFQDIAQYLPKIIPGARQAGFALSETAGAWAYLTAQGQSAEQSTTGLMNAFKALSNPQIIYGSKSKGGFKALGVDVFDASGKMRGLVDIVTDLSKVMNGLTDEARTKKFASIGLDMEAAGAFASMTQNVNELRSTIDFTTNSTGQLDQAVKNASTSTESWAAGWNKLKVMMIQYGQSFLPMLKSFGDGFNSLMDSLLRSDADRITERFKQQGIELTNLKEKLNPLLTEYDNLKAKTSLTSDEQSRLKDIITQISDVMPAAISRFDKFGNALDINSAKARGFVTASADALKILNRDAITEKKKEIETLEFEVEKYQRSLQGYLNAGINNAEHINRLRSALKGNQEILAIRRDELAELSGTAKAPTLTPPPTANTPTTITPSGTTEDSDEVQVNGGTPQKYINIHVEALHKGDNVVNNQNGSVEGMSIDELERKMNEVWFRLLRNSNAAF